MKSRTVWMVVALCAMTATLAAQPLGRRDAPVFRQEVRLQPMYFGNFFQAPIGSGLEEDIRGIGLEYRAAYRVWTDTEAFGHLNVVDFDERGKKTSYGGRAGLRHDGERHDYSVHVDHGVNRSSFDIAGSTETGDVTTLYGEYSFRVTDDWQLGVEAATDRQRFTSPRDRNNDGTSFGANVRYRGLGYKFMPEVGYVTGSRDVVDRTENYDESYWYIGFTSSPTRKVYLSLTYRDRQREYTTSDITSSRFGADEQRDQWTASASYRHTDHVAYILYYSKENADSSRANRDFNTDFLLLAVSVGF